MGLTAVKPLLTALVLPPVPWLVLVLMGAWQLRRRPWLGWPVIVTALLLTWFSWTSLGAVAVTQALLKPPPPLRDLKALVARPPAAGQTVVVVLGGGRNELQEYPFTAPSAITLERLRYGIWLSRQTGYPLLFSGGKAPGDERGLTEAEVATRVARDEFRHPLRWAENRSRDTHENAVQTIELLRRENVGRILLVSHDLHLPRALRHFERARDAAGLVLEIVPAGCAVPDRAERLTVYDFFPSPAGIWRLRYALREWLGIVVGA